MTSRPCLVLAALFGLTAVALGAYGAHGLNADEVVLRQFDTANRYHMWHSLALLGAGLFLQRGEARGKRDRVAQAAAVAFSLGILLFSGPLYAATALDLYGLTFIAPSGGIAFMAGWALLAVAAARSV